MSIAVGVDIGAYKHAVAVCRSGEREADRRTMEISADRAGFRQLATWMGTLPEAVSLVVMESSGHYWYNLASHLHRAGIAVAVVNPLESKYFGKRRLQRSKSDRADARTLAALGMHDQPRADIPLGRSELREAARFTMRLVREQAEVCQRIQRLIDLGFPELREVWEDPACVSALAVLRKAPTAPAVARLRFETLADSNARGKAGEPSVAPKPSSCNGWPRNRWPRRNSRPRSGLRCACSSSSMISSIGRLPRLRHGWQRCSMARPPVGC